MINVDALIAQNEQLRAACQAARSELAAAFGDKSITTEQPTVEAQGHAGTAQNTDRRLAERK